MMTKFSIITPLHQIPDTFLECYKGLELQVESFEWIIVLNGDSIEKSQVLESLKDQPILKKTKILYYQGPRGPSGPRNLGIDNAAGKYIVFLDSDDYLEARFLSTLSEKIQSISDTRFAIAANGMRYGRYKIATGKNNLIFRDDKLSGSKCSVNYIGSISGFCISNNLAVSFNENLTFFEDYDLYLKLLSLRIPIYSFVELIYFYCVSEDSLTGKISKNNFNLINDARQIIVRDTIPDIANPYFNILARIQLSRLQSSHGKNIFQFSLLSIAIFFIFPIYFRDFLRRMYINLNFR